MNKSKIIFVINPLSGTKSKKNIPQLIEGAFKTTPSPSEPEKRGIGETERRKAKPRSFGRGRQFTGSPVHRFTDSSRNSGAEILVTEKPGHATTIAKEAKNNGVNIVVAVGGDGTVNEIAKELVNTDIKLGIIPKGSGNGLARELKIPLKINKAVSLLDNCRVSLIDSCTINGNPFFNTAGTGLDAYVARLYAEGKKRGFKAYFDIVLSEFFKYKPQNYEIEIDSPCEIPHLDYSGGGSKVIPKGKKYFKRKAILISLANGKQYGNNIYLSPEADIKDGLVDVCILKPFPKSRIVEFVYRIFSHTIYNFKYFEMFRAKGVTIKREQPDTVHLDGEPVEMGKELVVSIVPKSLKVLVPV